ncbi:MAG: proton-conducting transporter membrane subunit [Candidatus Omnitrophota bacterium]|jgi:formate hydrogenlyase subunit 3/multisubunit Na+/H+ antiporter MnhD subunit
MNVTLYSLGILIISGLLALSLNRFVKLSNYIGAWGAFVACAVGLGALFVVYNNPEAAVLSVPWFVPYGSFSVEIDALGAVFLFPVVILSALSALYGLDYLKHYYGKKNIGVAWFFYNLLVASMVLVVIARNAVLFLSAWEVMSVSSCFLVLFEGERRDVARAGLIYLIATHIGTLFLLVMFILLGKDSGSFDFSGWRGTLSGGIPSLVFLCALVGFGTKSGFMPLHIWLPEAHPAAPSHVSALMSGVMIKTGIYGILRILTFLGMPCAWWGYLLIAIGIISGILGVLFALAQYDLKRLLAYSSIENIGIISIGIGLGVVGMSVHNPLLMVMGFAGGLFHVVNHSFFKGLLFLGAGAVYHETGTREIDVLGGLLKKMPITGLCFLIGAAAICGFPPLNGFISEFLIYFASFKSIFGSTEIAFVSLGIIASLALIGGLAAACFTKAFGIIFLGEPRCAHGQNARDPGFFMRLSMATLAGACIFIGLGAPFIIRGLGRIIADISGVPLDLIELSLLEVMPPLIYIVVVALSLFVVLLLIVLLRRGLLRGREITRVPTWDCGYASPDPRMQYTASSFAQPIVDFFKGILRTRKHAVRITRYFPDSSSFKTETADLFSETVFRPMLKLIHRLAEKLTWVQHGKLQSYILYILFALIALLIWKL